MNLSPDVVLLLEKVGTEFYRRYEVVLLISERLFTSYLVTECAQEETVDSISRGV